MVLCQELIHSLESMGLFLLPDKNSHSGKSSGDIVHNLLAFLGCARSKVMCLYNTPLILNYEVLVYKNHHCL